MNNNFLPPLHRLAENFLLQIELAVQDFPRYHKYAIGSDLRRQAMEIMRATHHAVYQRTLDLVEKLSVLIDEIKLSLQLAKQIKAFKKMDKFAELVELIVNMGKQCGGWLKSLRQANS